MKHDCVTTCEFNYRYFEYFVLHSNIDNIIVLTGFLVCDFFMQTLAHQDWNTILFVCCDVFPIHHKYSSVNVLRIVTIFSYEPETYNT